MRGRLLYSPACKNPDVADPKNPVICQIPILLASSFLLYHDPKRKMMIGLKPLSKNP
jgi:hypothetical protein